MTPQQRKWSWHFWFIFKLFVVSEQFKFTLRVSGGEWPLHWFWFDVKGSIDILSFIDYSKLLFIYRKWRWKPSSTQVGGSWLVFSSIIWICKESWPMVALQSNDDIYRIERTALVLNSIITSNEEANSSENIDFSKLGIYREVDSMRENESIELFSKKPGRHVRPCRYVFRVKKCWY